MLAVSLSARHPIMDGYADIPDRERKARHSLKTTEDQTDHVDDVPLVNTWPPGPLCDAFFSLS
jgi:hypothetical protein